jgi:hypothetical protein
MVSHKGRKLLFRQAVGLSTFVTKEEFDREIGLVNGRISDLQSTNVEMAKSHRELISGLTTLIVSQDFIQDSVSQMSTRLKELGVKIDLIEDDMNSIRKESFNTKSIIRGMIKNAEAFEHHYREFAVQSYMPTVRIPDSAK